MARGSIRALTLFGIFCLIPLVSFPRALFSDRTLFVRDIGTVWAPQVEAVVRQIAAGEFPFFDARRGFGQPLFADPRSEVLYPPAWIHWILPLGESYTLFSALHLVIAAVGAARLARRMIKDASLAALGAAGLAYGASGPLLSLVSHWHHLAAAAWMPWIIERADREPGEPTPWLSLSLLVALQILAGSPDYTLTTFVLCALRWLTRGEHSRNEGFRLILALSLGVALSAIQLLPSLVFARESARDPYPIGWAVSPLHPALTIETVLPVRVESWPLRPEARNDLLGDGPVWMFSHYLGLSVWTLALLGLAPAGRKNGTFAAAAVVLGVVCAWGVRNEFLQSVLAQVPLVSGLRFPTKHLAASSLGLAILAAFGVMALLKGTALTRNRVLISLAAPVGLGAALFLWGTEPKTPFNPTMLGRPLVAVACALSILLLSRHFARRSFLLPGLVAIDLLSTHTAINPTTPASLFRDRPPITATIPKGSRLYVSDYSILVHRAPIRLPTTQPYRLSKVPEGFEPAEALSLAATWYLNPPIASRFGYFGSFDRDVLDFYRAPLKRTVESFVTSLDPRFMTESLRRGSVDYVVTMDAPERWSSLPMVAMESRFFEAPVRIYKVPQTWPKARYETAEGALSEGSPRVIEMLDGRIAVETTNPEPTRLVLAVANDRGWRANVDGTETPISDNAMAFLSVPLNAGHHLVELVYRPPLIGMGAVISLLALVTISVLSARKQSRND